tara:strand:+ start:206 stop:898 length:693 start_codon:yes stop_codon:yes gene_type:complete
MSFGGSNITDSINRLTLLVNNIRHNQNLLIDYTIDNNVINQQQNRNLTHRFNNSNLFPPSAFFPPPTNINRTSRPTRNMFTTGPPNIRGNPPGNTNPPGNIEVSFIDSRNSEISGPLNSIFNNLFGETRDRTEILTFSEILNNTELDLYSTETNDSETTEPETCSICRDTISNNNIIRKIKKCSHYFHQTCLDNWLKEKNTCPNCRQLVVLDSNENDSEQGRNLSSNTTL